MTGLNDLYQEIIKDHNKQPRNYGALAGADHVAHGHNPLCGDKLTLYLSLKDDTVSEIHFEGSGCAISTASASLMTESVKGQALADVESLYRKMHHLLTEGTASDEGPDLDKLTVFSGVHEYPARVKCATLAWHTLDAAIKSQQATVSTED